MRPCGVTAVASTNTTPAPPAARLPKCTACQSLGWPSLEEYWHIGETQMRFASSTPRSLIDSKRFGIKIHSVSKRFEKSCDKSSPHKARLQYNASTVF